jgi:hypothetical protein
MHENGGTAQAVPENREDKRETNAHRQPGQKSDLFLMRGQFRLSSAGDSFWHDALVYTPGSTSPPSGVLPI